MMSFSGNDKGIVILIAIKQQNVDFLKERLAQISNPASPQYRNYLSREDIATITANKDGYKLVKSYLMGRGIKIVGETVYGEYISASASMSELRSLLDA